MPSEHIQPPTHPLRHPRVQITCAVVALLFGIAALATMRDYLVIRSFDPRWRTNLALWCALAGSTLIGVVFVIGKVAKGAPRRFAFTVGLFLLAAWTQILFFPRLHLESESPWRVRCASNLRQIGQALELYAADNHNALPPDLATLFTHSPDFSAEIFVCPTSKEQVAKGKRSSIASKLNGPSNCSYLYCGAGLKYPVADTVVLAYESSSNHDGDGGNVLYGDGHVEFQTVKSGTPFTTQP